MYKNNQLLKFYRCFLSEPQNSPYQKQGGLCKVLALFGTLIAGSCC
jgi:hypothetical protein